MRLHFAMTDRRAVGRLSALLVAVAVLATGSVFGSPTAASGQMRSLVPGQGVSESPDAGLSVIYLVRHAERAVDHPRDPNLSAEGKVRAEELARLLKDAPLTSILSSRYRRTIQTAAPVAAVHGLETRHYDAGREGLAELAETLAETPGHHLVVGHSNTTPWLVDALGGDPVGEISEMEYDRIYVVVVAPGGEVSSTLFRFGAR